MSREFLVNRSFFVDITYISIFQIDEKLWHAVVDHVTVYHDDRLVYSLKDGTEITIEL